jgi:diacylglycerol O-acyltransferase
VAADTVDHHLGRLSDVGRSVRAMVPRLLQQGITHPSRTVQEGVGTALAIGRFVRPVTRTSSPIMRERRNLRDFGHFDVSQHALSDAAHRQDSTLNDAFLAGIAGGLRRYHEHHRAAVDHLRISMPVNVRTERDGLGGNHVTVERFDLPVGTTDPARRMRRIREVCRALRHDPAIPYASTIASVLNLLPVDVTASMLRHVDLLASNVPGFPSPVYVGGARLEAFHVYGATLGSAANVTLMSYDGTCHVGVSTDTGAVPDPDAFLSCLQDGFAEVVAT